MILNVAIPRRKRSFREGRSPEPAQRHSSSGVPVLSFQTGLDAWKELETSSGQIAENYKDGSQAFNYINKSFMEIGNQIGSLESEQQLNSEPLQEQLKHYKALITKANKLLNHFLLHSNFKKISRNAEAKLRDLKLSEEIYMKELDIIANVYAATIQTQNLITPAEFNSIFGKFAPLSELHQSLFKDLQSAVLSYPNEGIGPIFLNLFDREKFDIYLQYHSSFHLIVDKLAVAIKENKGLANFIKLTEKQFQSIHELIRRPLQRLPEYINFLEELKLEVNSDVTDRDHLGVVIEKFRSLVDAIDAKTVAVVNFNRIIEVENRIQGVDENIVRPDRTFVYEAPLKLFPNGAKKHVSDYAFLFSDLLIYCTSTGKNYTFSGKISINNITSVEPNLANRNQIIISVSPTDKFIGQVNDRTEAIDWELNIYKSIRDCIRNRKLFGVPLHVLMKREEPSRQVPKFVEKALWFIYDNGLKSEGIFRISGRSTQVDRLKDSLNQGGKVFFSPTMDIHSIATLVKLWFRELPEPLFTWDGCLEMLNVHRNILDPEEQLDAFKKIIAELPECNRYIAKLLINCLRAIGDNQQKTKMSPEAIALVFAPNVLSTRADGADTTNHGNIDAFSQILTMLIKNFQTLFDMTEAMEHEV